MVFKNVKIELIRQDLTITRLAEIIGFTKAYVSHVIAGHVDSEKVKKAVALALNRDFDYLWGEDQNR